MSLSAKLRRAPLRIATGAYILNSGVARLGADDDTAKSLHDMAAGTYPFLDRIQPKVLASGLAAGEIAVGTAMLLPIVPPVVAGAALVGFSGAVLNMYVKTPGLHREGSARPTEQGVPMAKDVLMLGIGAGLIADATFEPAHDKVVEVEASVSQKRADRSRWVARRKARRAKTSNAEYVAKRLGEVRAEYGPLAAEKAKAAREVARHAAEEYGPVAAEKAKAAGEAARHAAHEAGVKAREARERIGH